MVSKGPVPVVVPAVLEHTLVAFQKRVRQVSRFAPLVHLDVVDGIFARPRTVGARALRGLPRSARYQLHLMVRHPQRWLRPASAAKIAEVIIHCESVGAIQAVRDAERLGFGLAIGVNPTTRLSRARAVGAGKKMLCLSVPPGAQGQPMVPTVWTRLRALRRLASVLAVDGGVRLADVSRLRRAGVTEVIVGSAIVRAARPAAAYRAFGKRFQGI